MKTNIFDNINGGYFASLDAKTVSIIGLLQQIIVNAHILCDGHFGVCLHQGWMGRRPFHSHRPPEILLLDHRGCYGIALDNMTLREVAISCGDGETLE